MYRNCICTTNTLDMSRFTPKTKTKSGVSECHSPALRSPDSQKWSQNQKKTEDLQRELMSKTSQFEMESKARKGAEQRCRETQSKLDRVYEMLQERTEEMEQERRLREEAEDRCRTLQLTIDKLEEYLRKKNAKDYENVGKQETEGTTINEVINKERKNEETCRLLYKQQRVNDRLKQRCEELERKLQENKIEFDIFNPGNEIEEELDF